MSNLKPIGGEINSQDLNHNFSLLLQGFDQSTGKVNSDTYYDEVKTTRYVDSVTGTSYQITTVPKVDKSGNVIKLKQGIAKDNMGDGLETPRSFSARKGATVVVNSAVYSTTNSRPVGTFIKDGQVIKESVAESYNYILGIDDYNRMKAFPPNTPSSQIISQGYYNALTAFIPLVENGQSVSQSVINTRALFSERHPRQAVGNDSNGNVLFFTSNGRRFNELGLTAADMIRLMISQGFSFGYMLDGGGSAQTVYYGSIINDLSDGSGTEERPVASFLYAGKDQPSQSFNQVLGPVGQISKALSDKVAKNEQALTTMQQQTTTLLNPYYLNGWKDGGTSGTGLARFYTLPNGSLYFLGIISGGESGKPFAKLPVGLRPLWSQHFLVPGDALGQVYKLTIETNGDMQIYYWSPEAQGDLDYIRLDGVMFPVAIV